MSSDFGCAAACKGGLQGLSQFNVTLSPPAGVAAIAINLNTRRNCSDNDCALARPKCYYRMPLVISVLLSPFVILGLGLRGTCLSYAKPKAANLTICKTSHFFCDFN